MDLLEISAFELTITPDAGMAVTLSNITFEAVAATAGPSTRSIYLLSNKTGYNTNNILQSASTTSGSPLIPYNTSSTGSTYAVDLSMDSAFSNITDSVSFRFYIQTPGTFQNLGFDDIQVEGSVASNTVVPAVVLVSYDMEETGGVDISDPSFTNSDVMATSMTPAGSHVEQSGKLQLGGSSDDYSTWRTVVNNGSDLQGAIDAAAYFIISITPNPGKSITVDSVSFNAVAGTAGPSTRSVYVMSSRAGAYTNGNELLTASTTSGSLLIPYNTAISDVNFEIDLSGNGAFTNITDTVFFRFYIQTPGTHQNLAFDDIVVKGFIGDAPFDIGDISMAVAGSESIIGWNAYDTASYSVLSNLDLVGGSWGITHSNLTGITGTMFATNSTTAPQCFYRVIIE